VTWFVNFFSTSFSFYDATSARGGRGPHLRYVWGDLGFLGGCGRYSDTLFHFIVVLEISRSWPDWRDFTHKREAPTYGYAPRDPNTAGKREMEIFVNVQPEFSGQLLVTRFQRLGWQSGPQNVYKIAPV
jgi:hypothetical protein